MARGKNRVQPTAYPRVPFHMIRSAQMVSSAVVVAVMAYFIGQLAWDGFYVPWTFMVVSLLIFLGMWIGYFFSVSCDKSFENRRWRSEGMLLCNWHPSDGRSRCV